MRSPGPVFFVAFLLVCALHTSSSQAVLPVGENFCVSSQCGPDAIGGRPAIAGDGAIFFAVWKDGRNQGTTLMDVYGARVSHSGVVLDTAGIPISTSTGTLWVTATPSVVFDGTNYFVVWVGTIPDTDTNEVFCARVSRSGVVMDTPEIRLTTHSDPKPRPISIAFDGTNFLVVWRTNAEQIRGMRVSPAGVNLDSPAGFPIATVGGDFYPWVAFGDTTYMVSWHGWGTNGLDIFGARVTRAGVVLDPEGFVIAEPPLDQEHVSVASDGVSFFTVYGNTDHSGVYGARISEGGVVLDNPPLEIADHNFGQSPVVAAYDGTQYFVVWHEDKGPIKYRATDVYGRRVSTAGTLLDERPIPISTSHGNQFGPVMGYDGGYYLVAWNESNGRGADRSIYGQILVRQTGGNPEPAPGGSMQLIRASNAKTKGNTEGAWTTVSAPTTSALFDIAGVDTVNIYASAEDGSVLRYDGITWLPMTNHGQRLYGIFARSTSDIWTAGFCWTAPHFDGQAWSSATCHGAGWIPNIHLIAFSIWGSSSTNMLTVGTLGAFQKFEGHWYPESTRTSYSLWDIWGSAVNDVYAVGEFGTIMKYNNSSWWRLPNIPTIQSLNGVWGRSGSDIFAVGDFGTILHHDGVKWSAQASNTSEDLQAVFGLSGSNVYAVGMYGTIIHYNGSTWSPEPSGTTRHLMGVWAAGNAVWAVGDSGTILKKANVTGLRDGSPLPDQYGLEQNYPNPFNPSTVIRYGLPVRAQVTLAVHNTIGQRVALLVQGEEEAGLHEVKFEGSGLASGVYFYRLQAGSFIQTKKLLMLR